MQLIFQDYCILDVKFSWKMGDNKLFVAAIDFGTTYSGYAFDIIKDLIDDPESVYCPQWYGDGVLCRLKFPPPSYWMRRTLLTLDIRRRRNMQSLPTKIFKQNITASVDLR